MIEKIMLTSEGKLRVTMPENLNEITLGQMIALQNETHLTDVKAISILTGIDVSILKQVKDAEALSVFSTNILQLAMQISSLYNSDAIPDKVSFVIDGINKEVKVIKSLAIEPAGAYWAAKDIIADEIASHIKLYGEKEWEANFSPSLQACGKLLAQYFYCRVTDKPYDEYAAADFVYTINNMRVTEALPISVL